MNTHLSKLTRLSGLIALPLALSAATAGENPIRRPDYCGVWGIWGGEKVSTEGRPWFKGVVVTTNWRNVQPAKERYVRIAEAFATRSAALGDPEHLDVDGLNVRRDVKGLNDVGGHIWTANYGMFLEQLDPNGTSVGYWRVGSKDERFGRFARGFDSKNGKTAMSFRLDDHFFANPAQPQTVKVRIVYFDGGRGTWALTCSGKEGKTTALRVGCEDTRHWQEKTVELKEAYFDHRLPGGADVLLQWLAADDTRFHMIEVQR